MRIDLRKIGLYILSLLFSVQVVHSQDNAYDSLLNHYLAADSILLDELEWQLASDSMDILDLLEKLLSKDFRNSQLSMRMGYTSDITYAGRNFGFNQFGLTGGMAYYHKTGIFGDVSGYWNSSLNPSYNPTIATLGYMGRISSKWTFTTSFDQFFYNKPDDEESMIYYPLTNSANVSTYFDIGKFTLAGDYSFMFGDQIANRLRFNLMYSISKKNWGFIDRFVFLPSVSVLLGNAFIYQVNPVYPEMTLMTRYDIRQIMFRENGELYVRYLWRNDREKYYQLEKLTYEQYKDELAYYEISEENAFGVMNYSLTIPFYIYINNFTIALSYFYNIPVALPGETLDLENNSYIGTSLIYHIPFKKKKK
jgi:hypothetical protein